MFNIREDLQIKNLEKTGCSPEHIQQCLHDYKKHEFPIYSHFGRSVTKGTILLHTCNGNFTLKFDEKNNWARKLEIL